jgi:hypothetical protein
MNEEQTERLQRMFRFHSILLAANVIVFIVSMFASRYVVIPLNLSVFGIGMLAFLLGTCSLYYWIPLLKSIRPKTIDVYVGKKLSAWRNDESQTFLRDQYRVNTEQSIRLYVVAGGNVLFQVNDTHTHTLASWKTKYLPVIAVTATLSTPRTELSTRAMALSPREKGELRRHIVRCWVGVFGSLVKVSLVGIYLWGALNDFHKPTMNGFLLWANLGIWSPCTVSFLFELIGNSMKTFKLTLDSMSRSPLLIDSEDSTRLRWSRILWTEDGHPASWRLSKAFKWKPAPPRRYS